MGIIKKQAYAGTILSYLGVVTGFITTAIIFPEYLTTAEIGLLSIFLSYAYIFGQFATLGTGRVSINLFPYFKNREDKHYGFFASILLVGVLGLIACLLMLFILKNWLINNANDNSALLTKYFDFIFPLTAFTFLFLIADAFNTTLFNVVRGIFLKELLQRLIILAAIIIFILQWVTFNNFLWLFVLATAVPAIALLYHVIRNDDFLLGNPFHPKLKNKRSDMFNIGLFGVLIGFSGMIILNIDRIMVERMMGLGFTGIYTTLAYFATLVAIPSRALLKISDPIIARAWNENNYDKIKQNYYHSSLNQFLIGSLLLIGIWGNIENILRILPPAFTEGKWVVLFIGLAFLSDMASGTATYILANSRYFKFQTYYILILVLLVIFLNYILIPLFGLTGAAIATFLSKLLANFIRYLLLVRKFSMQPYDKKFIFIILISLVSYLSGYFLPEFSNLYLDIMTRSALIGSIFIILAIVMKISPEINERVSRIKLKLLN